jgi:hypothetical protein
MPTVAVEDPALAAAVSVVLCAVPAVRESEDGLALTPAGRPLIVTATVPEKPFAGTAFTLTICPAPPAMRASVVGDTVSEKSAAGAGDHFEADPPPQERSERSTNAQIADPTARGSWNGAFCAASRLLGIRPDFRSSESLFCTGVTIPADLDAATYN